MGKEVKILGFSGSLINVGNKIWYLITPPNGEGAFLQDQRSLLLLAVRLLSDILEQDYIVVVFVQSFSDHISNKNQKLSFL